MNFKEARALYKSMGCSDADLKGPVIGIANSWNELVTGHFNLRQVAEFVKKGIYRAGGRGGRVWDDRGLRRARERPWRHEIHTAVARTDR